MSLALAAHGAVPVPSAMQPGSRREILSVQALRGLAVLLVLALHVEDMAHRIPYFENWHSWYAERIGYSAVDLFFVISGFIMTYVTVGVPFRPKQWAISRFIRIYPLYFIFTSLALAIFLVRPDQPVMGSGPHDFSTIMKSYLMLPQKELPLLFVGWTIPHEIVFYVTVFVVVAAGGTRLLLPALAVLSVGALARWLLLAHADVPDWNWPAWNWNVPSLYLWQFFMGALVCHYREQARRLGVAGAGGVALVFLIGGILFAHPGRIGAELPLRVLLFGLTYAFTLIAFLNQEERWRVRRRNDVSSRPYVVRLGDASYSTYLVHPFVLAAFGHAGRLLDLAGPIAWLWLVITYGAVLALGFVIYQALEKPVTAVCRHVLLKAPATPGTARSGGVS